MAGPKPLRADARRKPRPGCCRACHGGIRRRGAVRARSMRSPAGPGWGPGNALTAIFPAKEALFEAVLHDRLQRLADDARALRHAQDAGPALLGFIGPPRRRGRTQARPRRRAGQRGAPARPRPWAATAAHLRGRDQPSSRPAPQRSGAIRGRQSAPPTSWPLIRGILFALQGPLRRPGRPAARRRPCCATDCKPRRREPGQSA